MKVTLLAAALVLAATSVASAVELGSFDNSRLFDPDYNLLTGADMDTVRDVLTSSAVNVNLTDTVTPEFLATVDVFCTSKIAAPLPSPDEVQAMADWVAAGGIFIVTGECA